MATLVWRARNHDRSGILVLDNTSSATRFFHKAFSATESKRLVVTQNKYYYAASDEYKNFVIRFKGIKKQA